jgi:hypothetical protein
MGLDLTPRNYLEMLTDEYREYRDNRLSMRKAINCCGLSNALPEVIVAHHNPTDSPKDLKDKADTYRDQLRQRCQAHHTVRDFCEYSKHVKLRRKSVSVKEAERIKQTKGSPVGLLLALTHSQDAEFLVLRHQDDREEYMDVVLEQVIASWNAILDEDNL